MRTTLTLEADVFHLVKEEVHRRRATLKDVVNDAIRRGLNSSGKAAAASRYRIKSKKTHLLAGIDRGSFNRLVDELEVHAVAPKLRLRRK